MKKGRIDMAILNFFVWGLGFFVQRQFKRGLFWMASYALILSGIVYGIVSYGALMYLFSPFGRIILIGLIMVSGSLAFETYIIDESVQEYD